MISIKKLPTYVVYDGSTWNYKNNEPNRSSWRKELSATNPEYAVYSAAQAAYDDWGWEYDWENKYPVFVVIEVGFEDKPLFFQIETTFECIPNFYAKEVNGVKNGS